MYESSTKETSGCASNLLAHEDLGHFEESQHWNIQAKFYNVKFPLVYESDHIGDSLYHEDHGATLKHKCGKRIVALSLLSFPLIFIYLGLLFLCPLFLVRSLIPTCGGIIVSIILSSLGTML